MGEDVVPKRAGGKRRRRANVTGGRSSVRVDVKLSVEEAAMLKLRAAKQGVSLPRLLVESTLAGGGQTYTQQRDQMAELFSLHRRLGNIANNVNQLARWANTNSQFPEKAANITDTLVELCGRVERIIDQLETPRLVPRWPAETVLNDVGEGDDEDTLADVDEPGEWADVDDAVDLTGTALQGTEWDTWKTPTPPTGQDPK